jgi:formylglycine-generating enzyme required for sulfatase activity
MTGPQSVSGWHCRGDDRPGVGVKNGLPDVVWCPVPPDQVRLGNRAATFDVEAFLIAKYPITYEQYKAFLDAPDGYADPHRWPNLKPPDGVCHARYLRSFAIATAPGAVTTEAPQ